MAYQNSVEYIPQLKSMASFRPRSRVRHLSWQPWKSSSCIAGAKAVAIVVGAALCLNLLIGLAVTATDNRISAIESKIGQLKDEQIALLAERANLMSKKQVQAKAGEELALFVPDQDQVFKLR